MTCFAQTRIVPADANIRRRQSEQPSQLTMPDGSSISDSGAARRGALSFRKKISREQKKLLQPNEADLIRYAAFLKNPNTGLIKLFPDIGCEDNANIVRADANCLRSIPMSAFYSFREEEYTAAFLSDIRLKNDVLVTDGLLTQGILVALGDIALENVSLASSGLRFLTEFKPANRSEEALKQAKELIKGIKSDDYLYRRSQPALENTTYALRVTAYRGSFIQTFRGITLDMLAGDERVDITIAFRVLRKDEETGNFTLLWKELLRKDAPKVIFPKRGKKTK